MTSVATREFRIGDWAPSGRRSTSPPHKADAMSGWGAPVNQFKVVWLDEGRTAPLAVEDADGCRAAVVRDPA